MTKWLPNVSPDDRAVDVAARALATRLDAVRQYLKRVAIVAATADIHQLRVWSRRADATLSLYGDLIPRRRLQCQEDLSRHQSVDRRRVQAVADLVPRLLQVALATVVRLGLSRVGSV